MYGWEGPCVEARVDSSLDVKSLQGVSYLNRNIIGMIEVGSLVITNLLIIS